MHDELSRLEPLTVRTNALLDDESSGVDNSHRKTSNEDYESLLAENRKVITLLGLDHEPNQ